MHVCVIICKTVFESNIIIIIFQCNAIFAGTDLKYVREREREKGWVIIIVLDNN